MQQGRVGSDELGMENKADKEMLRKSIGKLRLDVREWRRMVTRSVRTERHSAKTDSQYLVVHGRILNTCRALEERISGEDARRQVLIEIERLVRPWRNTGVLEDAPRAVVADLLNQGECLEMELAGKRRRAWKRMHVGLLAAAIAAFLGAAVVTLLSWWTAGGWLWLDGLTAGIAERIRHASFTEHFAVAVFLSWLVGTWMISAVYKS